MAAGLAVLRRLRDPAVYEGLERRAPGSRQGLARPPRHDRAAGRRDGDALLRRRPASGTTRRRAAATPSATRALPACSARHLRPAVPVRVAVPLARPRRRGDRPHDRGGPRLPRSLTSGRRSPRRPPPRASSGRRRCGRGQSATARSSSRRSARNGTRSASRRSTRPTSSISAGRGSSRRPTPTRRSCSATTSTRTGSSGSPRRGVDAVSDLAELISLCGQLRAEDREGDGAAWAATAALLGAASRRGPRRPPDVLACRAARGARRGRGGRRGGRARIRRARRARPVDSRRASAARPPKASAIRR